MKALRLEDFPEGKSRITVVAAKNKDGKKELKNKRRNAAIALGNTGNPAFISHITRAMRDPEELVRSYAAWALGRIRGSQAMQILEASLARETGKSAREEVEAALAIA